MHSIRRLAVRLAPLLLFLPLALGAKPCGDCGGEVAEASRFCPHCGKKAQATKACPECATAGFADARFCAKCGARFAFALEDESRLVGQVAAARKAYLEKLQEIEALYGAIGVPEKREAVASERAAVERAARVVPVDRAKAGADAAAVPSVDLRSLEDADKLYEEAEGFRRSPNLFRRKENLRKSLEIYQKLILKFPDSDKVDDCAYRIGEIYESPFFDAHEKAFEYYEKCVAWNAKTDFDARWRAAEIAYERLNDVPKAIEWYRKAAEADPIPENRGAAKKRLAKLQPASSPK